MSATALDTAPITPTGYPDTLGDEQAIDLGTVGYVRLPQAQESGGTESCLVVSQVTGEKLTNKHKVRLLEAAAKLVGGNIAESVRNADKEMKKHWAQVYVHKSERSEFSRYVNTAESHRQLEDQVSYTLDSSCGSLPAELFSIIE